MQGYMVAMQIGICVVLMLFSFITDSLSKRRKRILFGLVFAAVCLIISEQLARVYDGDTGIIGIYVARISKFLNYELNLLNIFVFGLYVKDTIRDDEDDRMPKSLIVNNCVLLAGAITVVISQFTGLYYHYSDSNRYQRGHFYVLSYIYSSIAIIILAANIIKKRQKFTKKLFLPFLAFTLAPMAASIAHFIIRGTSLVSATVVAMTVLLYCFSILDANDVMREAQEKEMENARQMELQTADALAGAIDAKDTYTSGHSKRVAHYSALIAEKLSKSKEYCDEIYLIGLLHDVGKIGIPGSIINKDGGLTDEEYGIIKTHPQKGEEILSKITFSPNLSIGAHYHHERYDGKGYPEGIRGEAIPEFARIVAVADSYDAMTSKRSYRDGLPKEEVRKELLNGAGTQFDPKIVAVMVDLMDSGEV